MCQAAQRGRDPDSIKLVAVTKQANPDQMRELIEAGETEIGENRVKDAVEKKRIFTSQSLSWHMIGHLQSNKVKEAVKIFSVIHSVDSLKLAYSIDKEAKKNTTVQDILIEINVSGEDSKFGLKPEMLSGYLQEVAALNGIRTLGLMTMAPFVKNAEEVRPYFRRLKKLADAMHLRELSMGMTQDFEVAIEEGATMVRIGSALFQG